MKKYDVAVLGGGIAGLLIASRLSSSLDVVLIERQKKAQKNKYWLTESPDISSDLAQFVEDRYESMDFVAYDDTSARVEGVFELWNSEKLIDGLYGICEENGCEICLGTHFFSFRENDDALFLRTTNGNFRARLAIDCMGYKSPIVSALRLASVVGYYVLVGKTMAIRNAFKPVGLHNVQLARDPTYLEAFPTKNGFAHVVAIAPTTSSRSRRLNSEFNFLVRETQYRDLLYDDKTNSRSLHGIVPIQRLKRSRQARLLWFGEAAQINPAASAVGLTTMLRERDTFCLNVIKALNEDSLSAAELNKTNTWTTVSRANILFQQALFRRILNFNSYDFRQFVEELSLFDSTTLAELIFARHTFNRTRALALAKRSWFDGHRKFAMAALEAVIRNPRAFIQG